MYACAWMRFCLQVCLSTSNIQAWSSLIVLMMLWLPPWLPLQFQHKKNPKRMEKPDTRLNLCKRVTLSSTITNGSDTHTHRKKNHVTCCQKIPTNSRVLLLVPRRQGWRWQTVVTAEVKHIKRRRTGDVLAFSRSPTCYHEGKPASVALWYHLKRKKVSIGFFVCRVLISEQWIPWMPVSLIFFLEPDWKWY